MMKMETEIDMVVTDMETSDRDGVGRTRREENRK